MKGLILKEEVCDSFMGYIHGETFDVHRILVPEANNLAITPNEDQIYAVEGYERSTGAIQVGEIEVPDTVIEKARAFIRAKAGLDELLEEIKALAGTPAE